MEAPNTDNFWIYHSIFFVYISPILFIFNLLWNITTLMMCMIKLCTFYRLNKDNAINLIVIKRIQYILSKLTILTILYQSIVFISTIRSIITLEFKMDLMIYWYLWSLLANISIFLMQEHNTTEYERFLHIIRLYICCCWKSSIFQSLQNKTQCIENAKHETVCDDTNDTTFNTNDISTKPVPIEINDLSEFSAE